MEDELPRRARHLARCLMQGRVIPVLGAGANLCDRPPDLPRSPGCGFLPSGSELSLYLANRMRYDGDTPQDLMEVSSYIAFRLGLRWLYSELRDVFHESVAPSSLHRFLASSIARRGDSGDSGMLIVTTNYDDAMEQALRELAVNFDVIAYLGAAVRSTERGARFVHLPEDGDGTVISKPQQYTAISGRRTMILKIHGTLDRADRNWDGPVITESQYVDYLATSDRRDIPLQVLDRLDRDELLFLGYRMRDWNLLVIMQRLGVLPPRRCQAWAVQCDQSLIDRERWRARDITSIDTDLATFVRQLEAASSELADPA